MKLIKQGQENLLNLNPRVFLELGTESQILGRLVYELFTDQIKVLGEDIRTAFTGERGIGKQSGVVLNLRNVELNSIIKGLGIQFQIPNESITLNERAMAQDGYYRQKHSSSYLLSFTPSESTLNNQPNLITTLRPAPHLDNKNIVIGRLVKGMDLLNKLDQYKTINDKPIESLAIKKCGELEFKLLSNVYVKLPRNEDSSNDSSTDSDRKERKRKKKSKKSKSNKKEKHSRE